MMYGKVGKGGKVDKGGRLHIMGDMPDDLAVSVVFFPLLEGFPDDRR